ncbi:hypothetical protein M885DRAFT_517571 [Pelagophyceae sp. CCMP2097]|nr:hypothetical protein M885DRAFT_517571 [Pelagophyceae sp. CCMP2097]
MASLGVCFWWLHHRASLSRPYQSWLQADEWSCDHHSSLFGLWMPSNFAPVAKVCALGSGIHAQHRYEWIPLPRARTLRLLPSPEII